MPDEWQHIRKGPGEEASPGKLIHNQGTNDGGLASRMKISEGKETTRYRDDALMSAYDYTRAKVGLDK
jgi:hypothetical protein